MEVFESLELLSERELDTPMGAVCGFHGNLEEEDVFEVFEDKARQAVRRFDEFDERSCGSSNG